MNNGHWGPDTHFHLQVSGGCPGHLPGRHGEGAPDPALLSQALCYLPSPTRLSGSSPPLLGTQANLIIVFIPMCVRAQSAQVTSLVALNAPF